MDYKRQQNIDQIEAELRLAGPRSHEIHLKHTYGLRWGGFVAGILAMVIGSAMPG